MMKFTILTAFPELIQPYLQDGILSRACKNRLIDIQFVFLRDFATNKYKSVDDAPFGGADGMLITAEVLEKALHSIPNYQSSKVIYLSPQGKVWNSKIAKEWTKPHHQDFILIAGRYAGIDQRFINKYVDEEISIGDYILSGGELAALVIIESMARFIPGVLGDQTSADYDSFQNGLLEAPQFTRPQIWQDQAVPSVLTSGNHAKIEEWQQMISILVTFKKRPDLLKDRDTDWKKVDDFYRQMSSSDLATLDLTNLRIPYE